ncbi:lanthionine synthetase LanC family protein [Thalassiella azotivora]
MDTEADTEFAVAARHLADRVASLAVAGPDGSPTWTGDDVDPASGARARLVHGPVDDGLLTGRAGVALALSTAAVLPGGRAAWGRLAEHAVAAAARSAHQSLVAPTGPVPGAAGWQSGALGVAHAARWVARQQGSGPLGDAARWLAAEAVRALRHRPGLVPPYPDLLDGVAGHLLAVLGADLPPDHEDLRAQVARRLLEDLVAGAERDHAGARWPMAGTMPPVCGLAHGASGVALALTEAAVAGLTDPPTGARTVTGSTTGSLPEPPPASRRWDPDALAREAVRWEAGHHDPDRGGWPDLRVEGHVPALAWCHGALGAGVVAARRHHLTGDPGAAVAFARAHAASALAEPSGGDRFDATLCHGLAGAVELHLVAAEQLATAPRAAGEHRAAAAEHQAAAEEHRAQARRVARWITRAGRDGAPPWTCGLPGDGRTPVLLTGLAGVVLTLARCHDPAVVTSAALPGPAARVR